MKLFKLIKDIISPKKCYSCHKEGHFLCRHCLDKMNLFESQCYICKGITDNFSVHDKCKKDVNYDKIIVLAHYKNIVIKRMIKDAKFYNKTDILEEFGKYLGELIKKVEKDNLDQDYTMIPVPMFLLRKLKRGYNHSEILAREIARYVDIDYDKKLVFKVKNTRQQSKLSRQERQENLNNAFKINKKRIDKIDKKNIILVDDVVSSGSTINEIGKILKANGANKVVGLIIASD